MLSTLHIYMCVWMCAFSDAVELKSDIQCKAYALTKSHITEVTKANYIRCVLFVCEKMHEIDFYSSVATSNKQPRKNNSRTFAKKVPLFFFDFSLCVMTFNFSAHYSAFEQSVAFFVNIVHIY